MRTKIIVIVMSMLLVMPMTAFADEKLADAGITPDSWLYYFDQLGEEAILLLETDLIEEAKLLDGYSEERLAESTEMANIGETQLAEETLNEYQTLVDEVANTVDEAIEEGQDVTEVINTISERTVVREEVLNKAIENLPEQAKSTVKEKIEASNLRLATVKSVLVEKVGGDFAETAKASGLNLRETLAVKSLADQTGKSVDEVLALFIENDKDIELTIAALGLTEEAMKIVNEDFKAAKAQINETFKEEKGAIKENIKNKVKEAKEKANELGKEGRQKASQVKEQAKKDASQIEEQVKEEANQVQEAIEETVSTEEEQTKEQTIQTGEQAKEANQVPAQADAGKQRP